MLAAPVRTRTVEVLSFSQSHRAIGVLAALSRAGSASGHKVRQTTRYDGHADLLLLWGPGAPDRIEPMRQQVERGGHVVAMDLAYWDRDQKFRVSIDAPHPQAWVMRQAHSARRFEADRVPVSDSWRPNGPVLIAGIGDKAGTQYGAEAVRAWEREMIACAKAVGRAVHYRPKKPMSYVPPGVATVRGGTIEQALNGVSLVVTWHSNVAVDAIRCGVPVVCRDGAAAALYPSGRWQADLAPVDDATRRQFLANLSFFQWHPKEAAKFWAWLGEVLA
jgi:hypothetical protein